LSSCHTAVLHCTLFNTRLLRCAFSFMSTIIFIVFFSIMVYCFSYLISPFASNSISILSYICVLFVYVYI
jgi:uncharacterized BrkB/YihY/UPF0761 family membrane protein